MTTPPICTADAGLAVNVPDLRGFVTGAALPQAYHDWDELAGLEHHLCGVVEVLQAQIASRHGDHREKRNPDKS